MSMLNDMRRVLIIFHDSDLQTGGSAAMLDLIESLVVEKRIEFRAILPDYNADTIKILESLGVFYTVRRYYSSRYIVSKSYVLTAFNRIKSVLKTLLTFFSAFKSRKEFEAVDVIYSNTSDNYYGLFLSFFSGAKHIAHIREFGFQDQGVRQVMGDEVYYRVLLNRSFKVIVISDSLRDHILSNVSSVPDNLIRIYDDVHLKKRELPFEKKEKKDTLSLLIAGTLCDGKGQSFVIESLGSLDLTSYNLRLGIAGYADGSYGTKLKSRIRELNLDKVICFLGYRYDLEEVRLKYDVAIIASKAEAFGRVTIEAMCSGQLVLASDTGANSELVEHGVNGFLFKEGDMISFCSMLQHIANLNEGEIDIIIKNAFIFAIGFTSNKCASKINNILLS